MRTAAFAVVQGPANADAERALTLRDPGANAAGAEALTDAARLPDVALRALATASKDAPLPESCAAIPAVMELVRNAVLNAQVWHAPVCESVCAGLYGTAVGWNLPDSSRCFHATFQTLQTWLVETLHSDPDTVTPDELLDRAFGIHRPLAAVAIAHHLGRHWDIVARRLSAAGGHWDDHDAADNVAHQDAVLAAIPELSAEFVQSVPFADRNQHIRALHEKELARRVLAAGRPPVLPWPQPS